MSESDDINDQQAPIVVPPERLSPETLAVLAEEFYLTEAGNDPTLSETREAGKQRVLAALRKKTHLIVFVPETETFGIIEAALK